MSMIVQIELTPLEPYFFGSERSAVYGEKLYQLALTRSYYYRSERLPSQAALFGALRYLGIEEPTADFKVDTGRIGPASYDLTDSGQTDFGMIHRISPLFLADPAGELLIPAPRNHRAVKLRDDEGMGPAFTPYAAYEPVETLEGVRLIPGKDDYDEKARDEGEFFSLSSGRLRGGMFSTQLRVGINRQKRGENEGGFFKKEYVVLAPGFRFVFRAEVDEAYFRFPAGQNELRRTLYMGQGHTAFEALVRKDGVDGLLPDTAKLTAALASDDYHYRIALSDVYYPGGVAELRKASALMLAEPREYRVFTTRYGSGVGARGRFSKKPLLLRLIRAGSVWVFDSADRAEKFDRLFDSEAVAAAHEHAKTAGFNCIFSIDK